MKTRIQAIEQAKRTIQQAQTTCNAWAAKFVEDPAYQLAWASDAFKAGATLSAFKFVVLLLEDVDDDGNHESIEIIRAQVQKQINHGAHYPASSTSVTSNEYTRQYFAAMVDVLEMIERVEDEESAA